MGIKLSWKNCFQQNTRTWWENNSEWVKFHITKIGRKRGSKTPNVSILYGYFVNKLDFVIKTTPNSMNELKDAISWKLIEVQAHSPNWKGYFPRSLKNSA